MNRPKLGRVITVFKSPVSARPEVMEQISHFPLILAAKLHSNNYYQILTTQNQEIDRLDVCLIEFTDSPSWFPSKSDGEFNVTYNEPVATSLGISTYLSTISTSHERVELIDSLRNAFDVIVVNTDIGWGMPQGIELQLIDWAPLFSSQQRHDKTIMMIDSRDLRYESASIDHVTNSGHEEETFNDFIEVLEKIPTVDNLLCLVGRKNLSLSIEESIRKENHLTFSTFLSVLPSPMLHLENRTIDRYFSLLQSYEIHSPQFLSDVKDFVDIPATKDGLVLDDVIFDGSFVSKLINPQRKLSNPHPSNGSTSEENTSFNAKRVFERATRNNDLKGGQALLALEQAVSDAEIVDENVIIELSSKKSFAQQTWWRKIL